MMNRENHKSKQDLKDYVWNQLESALDPQLSYHALEHTKDVYNVCLQYIDIYNLTEAQGDLLLLAAVAHDFGFTATYKNHEEVGANMIAELMPEHGYEEEDIDLVKGMIMATKIPQSPQNLLEEILADSDLDYLGRNDYDEISTKLYEELNAKDILSDQLKWLDLQISFLESHSYHTDYAIKYRKPNKLKRLKILIDKRRQLVEEAEGIA